MVSHVDYVASDSKVTEVLYHSNYLRDQTNEL